MHSDQEEQRGLPRFFGKLSRTGCSGSLVCCHVSDCVHSKSQAFLSSPLRDTGVALLLLQSAVQPGCVKQRLGHPYKGYPGIYECFGELAWSPALAFMRHYILDALQLI